MSIEEFLDGMPSFDERNFSLIDSCYGPSKRVPKYISTKDEPNSQIIVNEEPLFFPYLHKQWNQKHVCQKRELETTESDEASGSTTKKRRKV